MKKGELDNLPGNGKPLQLDDDTHVPPDLRAGYRLLRNAGYLPPELQGRQEALAIAELLPKLDRQHNNYPNLCKRRALLKLKLKQAGLSTGFCIVDTSRKLPIGC